MNVFQCHCSLPNSIQINLALFKLMYFSDYGVTMSQISSDLVPL